MNFIIFFLCCFVFSSGHPHRSTRTTFNNVQNLIPEKRLIDLTHPYNVNTLGWPLVKKFKLNVIDNETTPAGYWLQQENYESGIHWGTHIDAPCHMNPKRWCLHQIPLNRFIAPAALVDITYRTGGNDPSSNLEVQDLLHWEKETGMSLNGHIVLVRTGWDLKWNNVAEFIGTNSTDESKIRFPGIDPEAARWIADNRDVYGVGIDTTSLDNGHDPLRRAHEFLFAKNIYGMENVANLYKLPPYGAEVYLFPMAITGSSGAPLRIIAYVPE